MKDTAAIGGYSGARQRGRPLWRAAGATALAALLTGAFGAAHAESNTVVPDRFTATTTGMTPRDRSLRIDVREWSDESGRAEVVAALEDEAAAQKALSALPTRGYVWQSGSGVGHSVKYAHRTTTPEGERLTFVTDKALGAYEFKPWALDADVAVTKHDYSVIELYLNEDGSGEGTLSLAADVVVDTSGALISLADGAPRVLTGAKVLPKSLWVSDPK